MKRNRDEFQLIDVRPDPRFAGSENYAVRFEVFVLNLGG